MTDYLTTRKEREDDLAKSKQIPLADFIVNQEDENEMEK